MGQATIPVVGYNYGSKQSDRVKQAWKVLLPTGIVFALCGTVVFLLFPRQLVVLVPCLWLLIRFFGVDYAWFAFWASEILACVYSLWAARKELKNKVEQQ